MVAVKRKRAEVEEEETVLVEFELREPDVKHAVGARQQLGNICKALQLDVFEVTDAILEQVNIGSLVCVPDADVSEEETTSDEDEGEDHEKTAEAPETVTVQKKDDACVLGLFSLLNLQRNKHALKGLRDTLRKHGGDVWKVTNGRIKEDKQVGFLICEQLIHGIPESVAVTALKSILDDIEWSLEQPDCEEDEKASYRYESILIVTTVFQAVPSKQSREQISESYLHPIYQKLAEKAIATATWPSPTTPGGSHTKGLNHRQLLSASLLSFADFTSLIRKAHRRLET